MGTCEGKGRKYSVLNVTNVREGKKRFGEHS